MQETAYAKLNLALHVRARGADGYHAIETIFAFCEDGDTLAVGPSEDALSLSISGPFAAALEGEGDNLVLAGARMLKGFEALAGRRFPGAALHLDKRLPVAAGLGGGSADAGAAIRLLDRFWAAGIDPKDLCLSAASLGADVPACIVSETRIGLGTGTDLAMPGRNDAAGLPVLLVNPGVKLATGPVFRAWDQVDRGGLARGSVLDTALAGRNDLEPAAISLCPAVGEVLALLGSTSPLLARMSGSGATCFGLYRSEADRDAAAARISAARPAWWMLKTRLR
jgi:4-diphosphocytidyl-2-C-methyl-D-erythritol kinase